MRDGQAEIRGLEKNESYSACAETAKKTNNNMRFQKVKDIWVSQVRHKLLESFDAQRAKYRRKHPGS